MRTFTFSFLAIVVVACGGSTEGMNDGGGGDGSMTQPGDSSTGMDGSTAMDSSTGMDSGGMMSTPGKVDCGMVSCTAGTEVCCIRGGGIMNPDAGLMYSCQPPMMQCQGARIGCDEAADCMGGVCCGGLSMMGFGARCTTMGMGCNMGSVQLCKTNQECGDAGACTTWTCPYIGQITSCTKPFMQCM